MVNDCQGNYTDFNSHAHVERDFARRLPVVEEQIISTHTLTWSVTISVGCVDNRMGISTHTLTWSVTTTFYRLAYDSDISTHTLTWSVTLFLMGKNGTRKFQLTRSRGA